MLTFEDFTVGRIFDLPAHTISAEEIIEFAQEFDPQPFHLDGQSDQAKQVGGLIASGWHTSAILMRMICDGYLLDSPSQGSPGLEEVRWLSVVRPGDTLSGKAEVTASRVSQSNPALGIVSFVYRVRNQRDEEVMRTKGVGMFKTSREAAS
ncbi:MAG: MaoC family dehydratase [Rhizobiaceae bacterium]